MGSPNIAVDADPVRRRLRNLQSRGMGLTRIAAVTGVPRSTLCCVLYGIPSRNVAPWKTMCRQHAFSIMSVSTSLAAGRKVDGTGTRRRLRALVARGWTASQLADRLDIGVSHLRKFLRGSGMCTEATRLAVAELYDRMWDVDPPRSTRQQRTSASKSMMLAARRGWAPPMAWDDDEIDDPAAEPFGAWTVDQVRALLAGGGRKARTAQVAA